ncbi:hypothetical protein Ancab_002382 [Ancistrocladus abbreviatus]
MKRQMGKSHTDTGATHHRRSYVDAVKGMEARTGVKHKLAELQQNGKTTTEIKLKHKAETMQNNEHSLLVFSSKVEDAVWLMECVYGELTSIDQALDLDRKIRNGKSLDMVAENKKDAGIPDTGIMFGSSEVGRSPCIGKGQGEPNKVSCQEASSSSGHVESGASLINDRINGANKPLEAKPNDLVSSSMPTELNESRELAKLGHGLHPASQSLDLQPRQNEPQDSKLVNNQQGLLSPIAMEGRITTGPQHLHWPLQPPSFPVDSLSPLWIDRESSEENDGQRKAMDSTRKKKTKSKAEISGSKGATGKNGRRSMRVQWKLLDAGMPRSPLFTEAEDSGMYPHDSQIENMNRLICKQVAQQAVIGHSPTPNQIWSFLTRIRVKETTSAEEMVELIKVMEQRDLKNFLETVSVLETDCAPVDQVGQ